MFEISIVSGIMLTSMAWIFLQPAYRRMRRRSHYNKDFPIQWETILEKNLDPYQHFTPEFKQRLHGHVQIFLKEVNFVGSKGLAVTEEIFVTIAGQACLLIANQEQYTFRILHTVIVYPRAYRWSEARDAATVLGESSMDGTVVLSWDDSKKGGRNWQDGRNVVLHEFAHQLDQEDGRTDGRPNSGLSACSKTWSNTLHHEYQKLCKRKKKRRGRGVIDYYGATNMAEFFSCATESFFEKPGQMQRQHTKLFNELLNYYEVDPREWE